MNKEKCIEIIENLVRNDYFLSASFGRKKDHFISAYRIISDHIKKMENDEEVSNDFDAKIIKDTTEFSLNYITDRHLNQQLTDFLKAWMTIVYNWNENLLKDENIARDCKSGIRILDQFVSIKEATDMIKKCTEQMRRYVNWTPPAFEVSKHILERLDNKE